MTDLENLTEWVKHYCNNDFLKPNPDYDEDDPNSEEFIVVLPGGVNLFLDKGINFINAQKGLQSESLGDYSVTFLTEMPSSLLSLLAPYKRVKSL